MAARTAPATPKAREPRARDGAPSRAEPQALPMPERRRALLDVNVLIALLDADHLHHARASAWLAENIAAGWASCAITQNGCVRIMSQPGYPNALPTARVAQRLREAADTDHHRFVAGDLSLLDTGHFDTGQLLGHRQVTDAWLLGLAATHGLRFVTFDAGLPIRVVLRAESVELVVL
jgi:toxin-antitoxin system PIN domain toxin